VRSLGGEFSIESRPAVGMSRSTFLKKDEQRSRRSTATNEVDRLVEVYVNRLDTTSAWSRS
jgi:hypothetical protein